MNYRILAALLLVVLVGVGGVWAVAPVSSFTQNSTGGITPIAIGFTDTSTGTPTAWNWSFNTTNALNENQANGGEWGNTTGFSSARSAVLTSNVTSPWEGTRSIYTTVPNTQVAEGWATTQVNVSPSTSYTGSTYLKGNGTVGLIFYEYYLNGTIIKSTTYVIPNISSSWQRYMVLATTTANTDKAALSVTTYGSANPAAFYSDGLQINTGSVATPWTHKTIYFSQSQNPSYLFTLAGNNSVSLITSNADGANSSAQISHVNTTLPTPLYNYTAYGDSITAANTIGGELAYDGSDAYVVQMVNNHNSSAGAIHNMDGGGQTSAWGKTNFAGHYNKTRDKIFVIEFGTNDNAFNITDWNATAQRLIDMKNLADANYTRVIIASELPRSDTDNHAAVTGISQYLNDHGTCYMNWYDAIDSVPMNGVRDEINASNYVAGNAVHPNARGQYLMSEYLWGVVSGTIPEVCLYAQFTPAGPTYTIYPNGQAFTDTSTGSPTGWNWTARNVTGNNVTFSFATTQNPTFTPPTSGNFSISLTASNGVTSDISDQVTFVNVSQLASNTTTKSNYITISALVLPTPNFNATPRYLTSIPQSVTFNFTGQNPHPVSYVWDFGDGGTTTIFAPSNPNTTHIYAASGSYTVSMTATNTLGTIIETKTDYISVSEPTMSIVPTPRNISYLVPVPMQVRVSGIRHADAIIGNFTYNQSAINVTQVNLNTSALSGTSLSSAYTSGYVSFNLTKPDQNYIAPTDVVDIWFNAFNVNNGTEPINYDLAFPMSNGVLSNSSFTVAFYNYTTKTEGSITLENLTYTRKIKFVDSSTLNMINTQIVTSYWWGVTSGNTATTDGYTTISAKYGTLTINATADAYYSTQQNIIFNTNDDYTLYMTPLQSPGTQKLNVLYPREVQFKLVDAFGKPLPNVQTSARMVNSTVTGTNWVATLYGIPNAADDIETTGMVGITDDIGVVVFPMIATNQYGLLFTNSTSGITSSKLVSPKDTSYVIYIPLAGQAAKNNTIAQVATSSLPWYKLNTSYYNLSMIYQDTNGYTTDVVFNVWDYTAGGTLVYTKNWGNPGTTKIVDNYTVYLPLGQEFRWQYNATKV